MKYLIIMALALPLLSACVHHHPKHRDGPGNSENAPGHNKHKYKNKHGNQHDHDRQLRRDRDD